MKRFIAAILLLFLAVVIIHSAKAKTYADSDNNGTGGITITDVKNTTDYNYTKPDITVTSINGIPIEEWAKGERNNSKILPPPTPGSHIPTPEEIGAEYDRNMRKNYKMPAEWFSCKTSDDCSLVKVPCSTSLAVSRAFREKAHKLIGDEVACAASLPDTSSTICKMGQCVTIINKYKP
jgi:hypothetical protein